MFGYPTCFVNGNMFAGVHQDSLFIRLSETDQETILSDWEDSRQLEPMPGRPMKEYVVLPKELYDDPRLLREWLDRSFQYVSSLPLKQEKTKKNAPRRP